MLVIEAQGLRKEFDGVVAVAHLDMEVHQGEIFGLLGPNGAGKTTTIRMLLDIIKPDAGIIRVLGEPLSERTKERIGYLPEERGLYRGYRLEECLAYFGQLKGLSRREAHRRARALLARVGLEEYARSKIKELSKGMQQKAQFIATILHDPDLVILDEPFQGLDPINVELVKEMIRELQERGKTVVLSTHMMNQVEALCQRILLINQGQTVLYGPIDEVKARYARHAVRLCSPEPLPDLPGVRRVEHHDREYELILEDTVSPRTSCANWWSKECR